MGLIIGEEREDDDAFFSGFVRVDFYCVDCMSVRNHGGWCTFWVGFGHVSDT